MESTDGCSNGVATKMVAMLVTSCEDMRSILSPGIGEMLVTMGRVKASDVILVIETKGAGEGDSVTDTDASVSCVSKLLGNKAFSVANGVAVGVVISKGSACKVLKKLSFIDGVEVVSGNCEVSMERKLSVSDGEIVAVSSSGGCVSLLKKLSDINGVEVMSGNREMLMERRSSVFDRETVTVSSSSGRVPEELEENDCAGVVGTGVTVEGKVSVVGVRSKETGSVGVRIEDALLPPEAEVSGGKIEKMVRVRSSAVVEG